MSRPVFLRRILPVAAVVLVLAAGGAAIAYGPGITEQAEAGTGFGARIACSCHFIEGRPLDQCRDDFEPGMGIVRLSVADDADRPSVTASVPMLASTTVEYRKGWGCLPEAWED